MQFNCNQIFLLFILGLVMYGCKPNFVTPIDARLIGRWQAAPITDDYEEIWNFEKNNHLTITINGDTNLFVANASAGGQQALNYIEYGINKGITKTKLIMDTYFYDPSRERGKRTPYFIFLKLTKNKMYLYSIDHDIKGGIQKDFTKID